MYGHDTAMSKIRYQTVVTQGERKVSPARVCQCLLQGRECWATSGFPQYCASTCVRFGSTQHASCMDTKAKFFF